MLNLSRGRNGVVVAPSGPLPLTSITLIIASIEMPAMTDYSKIGSLYARLEIDGTLLLAYRDLPRLLAARVRGTRAIDFGCGSGTSTRFLKGAGFETTGVDICKAQLALARAADPDGDYRLIERGAARLPVENADLVLSMFVFLEMADRRDMIAAARAIHDALAQDGMFVMIVCTERFYAGTWVSLNVDFPENKAARSGDKIRVRFPDLDLTIVDTYWTDSDYTGVLREAGFQCVDRIHPLGNEDDCVDWRDERTTAPFVIYAARKRA